MRTSHPASPRGGCPWGERPLWVGSEHAQMSAFGCDLNGSMHHLDGLGDDLARARLISITRVEFRFLLYGRLLPLVFRAAERWRWTALMTRVNQLTRT